MEESRSVSYRQLCAFFIPLGISASLTSLTHVIINGTLSRGENAAFIIACYAVAMSLYGIVEGPMIIFRQTTSTFVQNKKSFQLVRNFFIYVLLAVFSFCLMIAFTPLGKYLYTSIFNATDDMVGTISSTFQILAFVIIFSGLRAIYQGLIIQQLETNWLTFGVVARLLATFVSSSFFVFLGYITSLTGAYIFLLGVFFEALVSTFKGRRLLKEDIPDANSKLLKADIARFYYPLVVYYFLQSILTPTIYILLAKTQDIEMSIASFSMAFSITNMILGFFMYTHQLVLQFFQKKTNRNVVLKFLTIISLIPTLLLGLLCFTKLGDLFMREVMGADEALSLATLSVLKFFMIKTLIFPWVDFLNGFLMLWRKTHQMLHAQIGNLCTVLILLWIQVSFWPHLNGVNGSIAAAIGEVIGFLIIFTIIIRANRLPKSKIM